MKTVKKKTKKDEKGSKDKKGGKGLKMSQKEKETREKILKDNQVQSAMRIIRGILVHKERLK